MDEPIAKTCSSCRTMQPPALEAGANRVCELCAATLTCLKGCGFEPEAVGWAIRLDPELTARLGGVGALRELRVAPLMFSRRALAVVLVSGHFTREKHEFLFQVLPARSLCVCHVVGEHLGALLERVGPLVPEPLPPSHSVSGIVPDPIVVTDTAADRIAKRRLMPLRKRDDRIVVARPVGEQTPALLVAELNVVFGVRSVEFLEITEDEFEQALKALPWGQPLRFGPTA